MCARHGNIRLSVNGVVITQGSKPFEDTITLSGVTRCNVQDEVHKAVIRVSDIADDEGARVQALAQTGSDLV